MSMPEESELLEYETEQPGPAPLPAVAVYVTEPVVTVPTVAQHLTTFTVVVATGTSGAIGAGGAGMTGVDQLLPEDPLRVRATVWASDNPVVLCHSIQQAADKSNQVASVPNPNGTYLPVALPVVLSGTAQMFVAATTSTAARVSVVVERRSA